MYGYITLDKMNMYFKDHVLYRAFYCGNCLITKKKYGNLMRLTTNYDMTFMQVLLHSFLKTLPEYQEKRCLFSPRKKLTVVKNPLMDKLIDLNILFAYYKLNDDKIDGKRRAGRLAIRSAYKKARRALPECDKIIQDKYNELRELEKQRISSIDRAAHPFSEMLRECANTIAGDKHNDDFSTLCYNIGKYVYLMDALDDITEDFKSKNYNPFLLAYGEYSDRRGFFKSNENEISFIMNATINSCIQSYTNLNLEEGRNLLDNIILLALRRRFKQLLESERKLKQEKM